MKGTINAVVAMMFNKVKFIGTRYVDALQAFDLKKAADGRE